MIEWGIYLLVSGSIMGLFLIAYRLWLAGLTHFQWNRAFLLVAVATSLILPPMGQFVDLPIAPAYAAAPPQVIPIQPAKAASPKTFSTETAVNTEATAPTQSVVTPLKASPTRPFPWKKCLLGIYLLGAGITFLRFLNRLIPVLKWRLAGKTTRHESGVRLLLHPQIREPFSFLNRIYLNPEHLESDHFSILLAHESVHIRQKHSYDMLLAELVSVFWWCFPYLRYFRTTLRELHEFQADRDAARTANKLTYAQLLLQLAQQRPAMHSGHFFALSLTTKRIFMLHKHNSSRTSRARYLAILPLFALGLMIAAMSPQPVAPDSPKTLTWAGEPVPLESETAFRDKYEAILARLSAKPDYCRARLLRANRYHDEIVSRLTKNSIPEDFYYLAIAESGLNKEAHSSMGACGIWQFMEKTARSYGLEVSDGKDERQDLHASTDAAIHYLKDAHKELGSWTGAALAYNKGVPALKKVSEGKNMTASGWYGIEWGEDYLPYVLAWKTILSQPEKYGIAATPTFIFPMNADTDWEMTSAFGIRKHPFSKEMKQHTGVDFRAESGTPVYAVFDGVVAEVTARSTGRGNEIVLQHDGYFTVCYTHLSGFEVEQGKSVKQGDLIGYVGATGAATGPHLHFELHEKGVPVDPDLYMTW